jgi:hypothetical protein
LGLRSHWRLTEVEPRHQQNSGFHGSPPKPQHVHNIFRRMTVSTSCHVGLPAS